MATVTFFGHRDTPKEIEPALRLTLIDLIENKNATVFYVGNHGNFDAMVRRQLEDLSKTYPIKYYVVLAYMPSKNGTPDEHSILPEGIETVPRRFAINYRNKWMLILCVISDGIQKLHCTSGVKPTSIAQNPRGLSMSQLKGNTNKT